MHTQRPFRNTPKYLKLLFWGDPICHALNFFFFSIVFCVLKVFLTNPIHFAFFFIKISASLDRCKVTCLWFYLLDKNFGWRTNACSKDDFQLSSLIPGHWTWQNHGILHIALNFNIEEKLGQCKDDCRGVRENERIWERMVQCLTYWKTIVWVQRVVMIWREVWRGSLINK